MGKAIAVTLQDEVYQNLVEYLKAEFGEFSVTSGKSLVINAAVRDYLERKAERKSKTRPPASQKELFAQTAG